MKKILIVLSLMVIGMMILTSCSSGGKVPPAPAPRADVVGADDTQPVDNIGQPGRSSSGVPPPPPPVV